MEEDTESSPLDVLEDKSGNGFFYRSFAVADFPNLFFELVVLYEREMDLPSPRSVTSTRASFFPDERPKLDEFSFQTFGFH